MGVYVGPNRKLYHIHKRLLLGASRLLQRSDGSVDLPNEEPRLFQVYMEWLYGNRSKTVFKAINAHEVTVTATGTEDMPGARALIELYLLGERLRDVKFKNAVVDAYIKAVQKATNSPACFAAQIYSQLPTDSPFRHLYVDMWAWYFNHMWFEDLEPGDDALAAPGEFWLDVTKKSAHYGKSRYNARAKPPWVANKAQYLEEEVQEEDEVEESDEMEESDHDFEAIVKQEAH